MSETIRKGPESASQTIPLKADGDSIKSYLGKQQNNYFSATIKNALLNKLLIFFMPASFMATTRLGGIAKRQSGNPWRHNHRFVKSPI
ncbi:MAG: hypothetical protein GY799_02405 [Desulfobulbaceae bacterium]|nr:hypothetical protein [Desulfobulbaceae bacterium]